MSTISYYTEVNENNIFKSKVKIYCDWKKLTMSAVSDHDKLSHHTGWGEEEGIKFTEGLYDYIVLGEPIFKRASTPFSTRKANIKRVRNHPSIEYGMFKEAQKIIDEYTQYQFKKNLIEHGWVMED